MTRKALWLLVLALATGLIAAGCGDDDDDGDDGGDAPTKTEFIAEADQICSDGDAEIEAAAEETFGQSDQPPAPAEQERFASETVIPNIEEQVNGVDELTPPEGDEDQIQALVDAAREGIERGKEDPSLFLEQGGEDPLAEASRIAQEYGFKACGS
jgi:hypothetical protein